MSARLKLPDQFIHQATRYCLGRMTTAVEFHCSWLVANWDKIPKDERMAIQHDVEAGFEHDDRWRTMHGGCADRSAPLGHNMDRLQWERVRALWKKAEKGL